MVLSDNVKLAQVEEDMKTYIFYHVSVTTSNIFGKSTSKANCLGLHENSSSFSRHAYLKIVLAGDQWWPRTSGGRLRFANAITHLLRHRFGHFVNSNK